MSQQVTLHYFRDWNNQTRGHAIDQKVTLESDFQFDEVAGMLSSHETNFQIQSYLQGYLQKYSDLSKELGVIKHEVVYTQRRLILKSAYPEILSGMALLILGLVTSGVSISDSLPSIVMVGGVGLSVAGIVLALGSFYLGKMLLRLNV